MKFPEYEFVSLVRTESKNQNTGDVKVKYACYLVGPDPTESHDNTDIAFKATCSEEIYKELKACDLHRGDAIEAIVSDKLQNFAYQYSLKAFQLA